MERGRPVHVASQPDRGRIEVGGDGHPIFLGRVQHGLNFEVFVERLAAAAVNVADGGADLGFGVGVNVLFEKVDQAAVSLQDGEHPEVGAGGGRTE